MKRTSILIAVGLMALLAFVAAGVQAGNGEVSIDRVIGAKGHDTLNVGVNLRFLIRFNNSGTVGIGAKCDISNGWKVTSPDGAKWDSVNTDSAGPNDLLDQSRFLQFFDITGASLGNRPLTHADTVGPVGFVGVGTPTNNKRQLPITWNDTSLALIVYFHDSTSKGKHLCIDTSGFLPQNTWKWIRTGDQVEFYPAFTDSVGVATPGYGFCYVIYDPNPSDAPAQKNDNLPKEFALGQNYPNPFNPSTVISFDVPTRSRVAVSVYNVLGQKVTTVVDQEMAPGRYTKEWDGTNSTGGKVGSGIYFYKMEAGSFVSTKKMVMLK